MEINQKEHKELVDLGWCPDFRMAYQDYYIEGTDIRYNPRWQDWFSDICENGGNFRYYDVIYSGDLHQQNILWKGFFKNVQEVREKMIELNIENEKR
jgi:hypothetical protein